jgi:hypothetical protein
VSTCETLITRAHRALVKLGPAESIRAIHVDRGMEELQALYDDMIPLLAALTDTYTTASTYTANENERIIAPVQTSITITLPASIEDEITGDTRAPRDCSVVVQVFRDTGARKVYVFDATTADWVRIDTLAITDTAPLSARYSNALSSMLAMRLAELSGMDPPASVLRAAAMGRLAMASRYENARPAAQPDYF